MEVLLLDYHMGNLRSVSKALEKVGFKVTVSSDPEAVRKAYVLVLPGVGAFKKAMENLQRMGLLKEILRHIERGKPYMGICLGLQLLFERGYEFGKTEGFGVLSGEVVLLPPNLKVPHIGWNQLWIKKPSDLLEGIRDGEYFYFVHSYHAVPKRQEVVLTTTDYGVDFVSSVEYENLFAVQFHPEKSQRAGLTLLRNFRRRLYG
ncbi:MAG: imidazole glycerol phosphate synthase subunit HisH [Aquificaceae bacterium]|nr:imidazole glycerol phosphate synthase subunit HisH [Aquificaceae bacterium]MCX7990192.1 imidazole glycerol phosphate synthase subunit HisH [Aquificaceae bacterium]MDW8032838.1 imidazole glycerol phosphate synthase subunit HisH [Aquificaceae bacterium]